MHVTLIDNQNKEFVFQDVKVLIQMSNNKVSGLSVLALSSVISSTINNP
jgi:hypothetical protein